MKKKGQAEIGLGVIMSVFIAVLVGVVLFQTVAQEAGKGTSTLTYDTAAGSAAYTFPADGVSIDLTGQEYISDMAITNDTTTETIPASNYTISEGVSTTTGVKTIILTGAEGPYTGDTVNASYVYGPDGYIDNSGGRAMAGLIAVFFALAIAIIAISPTLKSGILNIGK